MKKFTALYIFINAARAPGSAGIQAEALANWCIERRVANYRYFADHENVNENKGDEMNVRAALTRMMAKVKKQKVSQVVCLELDQLGSSPLERRFVLETCKNLSIPVLSISEASELDDTQKEIDRLADGTDNSVPPAQKVLEIEPTVVANEIEATAEIEVPAKKRGRKMTRNVGLINLLLDEGQSLSKIAKAAGCSRATVQLQKKLWSKMKLPVDLAVESPPKVPDCLPDGLIEQDQASDMSGLSKGELAYA